MIRKLLVNDRLRCSRSNVRWCSTIEHFDPKLYPSPQISFVERQQQIWCIGIALSPIFLSIPAVSIIDRSSPQISFVERQQQIWCTGITLSPIFLSIPSFFQQQSKAKQIIVLLAAEQSIVLPAAKQIIVPYPFPFHAILLLHQPYVCLCCGKRFLFVCLSGWESESESWLWGHLSLCPNSLYVDQIEEEDGMEWKWIWNDDLLCCWKNDALLCC